MTEQEKSLIEALAQMVCKNNLSEQDKFNTLAIIAGLLDVKL